MAFTLHPRLANGTFELGRIGISRLLLKNNALFPWFLLVPEVEEGVEDLHQLDEAQYADVTSAIRQVSQFVADYFQPEKLNVASIGNQVRQMHVHLVGRSPADPAWPGTVWAFEGKQPYAPERVEEIRSAAAQAFGWERSV
jgi:diadenosine tetraphosphate (Ap4A) HIT family hydrolase